MKPSGNKQIRLNCVLFLHCVFQQTIFLILDVALAYAKKTDDGYAHVTVIRGDPHVWTDTGPIAHVDYHVNDLDLRKLTTYRALTFR